MVLWPVLDETINWAVSRLVIIFMYWKLLGKYCRTVTHVLFHCSTVYTVILFRLLLLHHWYCYCHRIVPVIEITWILITLNNNINRQLTPGLEKLMERQRRYFGWTEDIGCAAEIRFHCRVLRDDRHPVLLILLFYWLPRGMTWFSARWLGHGSWYVRNTPKSWTMSPTDQFQ